MSFETVADVTLLLFYQAKKSKFGCFSNFDQHPFTVEVSQELPSNVNDAIGGVEFPTAEHAIMAAKSGLFGDDETLQLIKNAPTPLRAKRLGRKVRRFDDEQWRRVRAAIARVILTCKFSQIKR